MTEEQVDQSSEASPAETEVATETAEVSLPESAAQEATAQQDASEGSTAEKAERKLFQVEAHHDTDEVARRLFAAPDLSSVQQEVSSIWGWVSSKSASLKESAEKLSEKATPLAGQWTQTVREAAESVKSVAEMKSKEFLASAESFSAISTSAGEPFLPWEEPASKAYASAIRDRILELSEDEKTFLIPPPEAVKFTFDFDKEAGRALKIMQEDSRLQKKRFELVPKQVEESDFWRNYFYRVSLILEAYQVSHHEETHGGSEDVNAGQDQDDGDSFRATAGELSAQEGARGGDEAEDGWGKSDDLNLNDVDVNVEDEEDENFDMLDDDELLASTGLSLDDDDGEDDEDDDDALEARIKAELNLS